MYSTIPDAIKMVGGTRSTFGEQAGQQGRGQGLCQTARMPVHRDHAKENIKVAQCFEELVTKMLETPQLVEDYGGGGGSTSGSSERKRRAGGVAEIRCARNNRFRAGQLHRF